MKLKQTKQYWWILRNVRNVSQIKRNFYSQIFYPIAIVIVFTLAFFLGAWISTNNDFSVLATKIWTYNQLKLIKNVAKRTILVQPEYLTIDIKHNDFLKLTYQRELALKRNVLIVGEDDYVPATIRHGDKSINVNMRLKGDWVDHFTGDKWSYRIKVKGNDTLFGMKQFSLHHPQSRNYVYEWLFHQALKRESILSLRYKFINVNLNGKDLGVYALEEHFEKRLIEHNEHREGPIIRFNEDLWWAEAAKQRRFQSIRNGTVEYTSSDIDAFHTNKILADPTSYAQYVKALNLLESFRKGELKTSEVFDVQKFATFLAISDLMSTIHGTAWQNARFYYNPVTSRLEPIGFDGNGIFPVRELVGINIVENKYNNRQFKTVFDDMIFFEAYIQALEYISEPDYLDEFLSNVDNELQKNLVIIGSEFPEFRYKPWILRENQAYIKSVLNPVKGLHAYYHEYSENQLVLELGNIQGIPIEVVSVSYQDFTPFFPTQKVLLPSKERSELVDYQQVRFVLPDNFVWSNEIVKEIKINYKLLGVSQIREENVFQWSHLSDDFIENDFIRQNPNINQFNFLTIDEKNKEIFIQPGVWQLDQNLIIPPGYQVISREGTQLNLSNESKILSYSPLHFEGSEDYPIIIQSLDATGQGIVVMNTDQKSILKYVIFNNLSNPSQNGWELTGSVTFYESIVDISYVKFINIQSEDALNIIRSLFVIDKTIFNNVLSDAFDADFSKGKITRTSFIENGNDAIDISGSVVEIKDIFINKAGDKGLSIGENSQLTAQQTEIKNSEIAVASKDLSSIKFENIHVSGCEIGFAIYQKKSEFGPASINIENLDMQDVNIPYLVEENSKIIVDDEEIKSSQKNVKEVLYGMEFGKSSK